jgi:glutathione S-transferase
VYFVVQFHPLPFWKLFPIVSKHRKGRAETTRLLLAAAEATYRDTRFDSSAFAGPAARGNASLSFAEFKQQSPFGQVPVLLVDGSVYIAQSRAIERFVARRFGLFGATPLQSAQIDAIAELLRDLQDAFEKLQSAPRALSVAASAQLRSQALADLGAKGVLLRDRLAQSSGFLVGSAITYADIAFFYLFHDVVLPAIAATHDDAAHDELAASVPTAVRLHVKKIAAIPTIAEYLETRPIRSF